MDVPTCPPRSTATPLPGAGSCSPSFLSLMVAAPTHAQTAGDTRELRNGEITKIEKALASVGTAPGIIQVYVHVINSGTGLQNGDVPDSQIADQISFVNSSFASTGWSFTFWTSITPPAAPGSR